jgi:arginase family enzyme
MDITMEYIGRSPNYSSFDIDVLDPIYAPSTGIPIGGGLTLREGNFISTSSSSIDINIYI